VSEEMLNVLDEHGNKTGKVLPRKAVHEHELRDGVVFVWVYNPNGEVLLQKRAAGVKSFPGLWDVSAGGHIAADEKPIEAVIKELREELGVIASTNDLELVGKGLDEHYFTTGKLHKNYYWLYIFELRNAEKTFKFHKEEVSDARWVYANEILADIEDSLKTKQYARRNHEIYKVGLESIISNTNRGHNNG
jgi:isopentenyl-diphosphate delta-isomerase